MTNSAMVLTKQNMQPYWKYSIIEERCTVSYWSDWYFIAQSCARNTF